MQSYNFIFNNDPCRIDQFLANSLTEITRSNLAKIIELNLVKVNGINVKKSYKLKKNDSIDIIIPNPEPSEIKPEKIDFEILYEDTDIIVINKKRGIVVHPGAGNSNGTLVNGLLYHCGDLTGVGGVLRPGVVHRLDKDTSGVIIFAKNQKSLNNLANQFKNHTNYKKYLAVVSGNLTDSGSINTFYGRSNFNRLKYTGKLEDGKKAVTHFKTIKRYNHFSLVDVILETGRTHQIRVHFSENGFPLLGDPLYGFSKKHYQFLSKPLYQEILSLSGQMLHAHKLEIIHPVKNKKMMFLAPIPKDFLNLLYKLKEFDQ